MKAWALQSTAPVYAIIFESGGYIGLSFIKRPARDACLCMGDLQAPPAPAAPHFVFLITL